MLLSARLRIDARPENPNANGVRAYFGDDAARYEERSPVTYAANVDVPTFLVIAEFDTLPFYLGVKWLSRYMEIDPTEEHDGLLER